jgi:hypothetical protein
MRTPPSAQLRTAVEMFSKFGQHLNSHAEYSEINCRNRRTVIITPPARKWRRLNIHPHQGRHHSTEELAPPGVGAREAVCFSSSLRQGTLYPLLAQGFCVRETAAASTRNIRVKRAAHGRDCGNSANSIPPRTGRRHKLYVSANIPWPRSVRANRRVHEQAAFAATQRMRQSANWPRPRPQTVRSRSATRNSPRTKTDLGRNLSANGNRPEIFHVVASQCPSCRRSVSRFGSKSFPTHELV